VEGNLDNLDELTEALRMAQGRALESRTARALLSQEIAPCVRFPWAGRKKRKSETKRHRHQRPVKGATAKEGGPDDGNGGSWGKLAVEVCSAKGPQSREGVISWYTPPVKRLPRAAALTPTASCEWVKGEKVDRGRAAWLRQPGKVGEGRTWC